MTTPVHRLSLRFVPNATLGRDWKIMIDQASLLELLEDAVKHPVAKHWREKNDARVDLDQLAASVESPGSYAILICAHCATLGYRNAGDLLLHPFEVAHVGEYIVWQVAPPGYGIHYYDGELLQFRFHRPQYAKAILNAIKYTEDNS